MPIGINGTGSITGLSAGGLPDASVQQADLATGVGGTGPAFIASGSTTSAANATNTDIVFTTESYDTASCFNPATGRFTPNVAGYYFLCGSINFGPGTGGGKGTVIRKNGSGTGAAMYFSTGDTGAWESGTVSALVYLNGTTDYATLSAYIASGGPQTVSDAFFSGFLARAA